MVRLLPLLVAISKQRYHSSLQNCGRNHWAWRRRNILSQVRLTRARCEKMNEQQDKKINSLAPPQNYETTSKLLYLGFSQNYVWVHGEIISKNEKEGINLGATRNTKFWLTIVFSLSNKEHSCLPSNVWNCVWEDYKFDAFVLQDICIEIDNFQEW